MRTPSSRVQNLTVFDGFALIFPPTNPTLDITLSGFQTPPSGTPAARLAVLTYDGDLNQADSMLINGTAVSNAVNPANDVANSTISNLGSIVTARNPKDDGRRAHRRRQ